MIIIKSPASREDFKAYYALRYKVLSEPLGHPKGTEKDDYEPISEHFCAVDEETGEIVGAVKLFERSAGVGAFSHLAVDPRYHNQGIGRMLLKAVEQRARARGFKTLGAMSRVTATAYFEKQGYHVAGIPSPHLGMVHTVWLEKSLA